MKLTTFDAGNGPRAGVLTEDGMLDAWQMLGDPGGSGLRELIAGGHIDRLRTALTEGAVGAADAAA